MNRLTRRNLIKTASLASTGFWMGTAFSRNQYRSANEKLNLAFIGVGGRGTANLNGLKKNHNVVAMCDVDGARAKKPFEEFSTVKKYTDFRVMLDAVENQVDGVVISTPDHTHFHPAYQALQMGKHIYLEKPMAHNVWETRTICDLAREKGVATQLGVQRHTIPNMHRVVELIQSGAIGKVSDVYCWISGERGMPKMPESNPPVPPHLNYDLWVGPADHRPYQPSITPYGWRFWWDYGTGETGNWACHILDIPFWALDLKHPTRVSCEKVDKVDKLRTPKSMKTTLEYPANGNRGPVKLHWQHVKNGPDILRKHGLPDKGNNTLFVGSEGMLLAGFSSHKLYPEDKFSDFQKPAPSIPDSPGFYQEWVTACQGGPAATCNFEYSGPLAETALLANVAFRSQSDFDWDAANLKTNSQAAQSFIQEKYRQGWEIPDRTPVEKANG